jgi:hypothetical protein
MSSELEELKQVVAQLQKQVSRLSGTSLPNASSATQREANIDNHRPRRCTKAAVRVWLLPRQMLV